ncbi:MAG: hypothetical protein ACLFPJ_06380 [Candidatus Woesearchaeota archaeon]
MKKSLMYSKNGNYEVEILETADKEKSSLIEKDICPNCKGSIIMIGFYNDGMFELFKCQNCNNHYAK